MVPFGFQMVPFGFQMVAPIEPHGHQPPLCTTFWLNFWMPMGSGSEPVSIANGSVSSSIVQFEFRMVPFGFQMVPFGFQMVVPIEPHGHQPPLCTTFSLNFGMPMGSGSDPVLIANGPVWSSNGTIWMSNGAIWIPNGRPHRAPPWVPTPTLHRALAQFLDANGVRE